MHLSPPRSTRACRSATCRKLPRTLTREPPCAMTGPGCPWTGTPPTSSRPTSPEQPAKTAATPVPNRSPGVNVHDRSRTAVLDGSASVGVVCAGRSVTDVLVPFLLEASVIASAKARRQVRGRGQRDLLTGPPERELQGHGRAGREGAGTGGRVL